MSDGKIAATILFSLGALALFVILVTGRFFDYGIEVTRDETPVRFWWGTGVVAIVTALCGVGIFTAD